MNSPQKVVIVVPTIRENNIKDFLSAWDREFQKATLVIVEDNPERTFKIGGSNVQHFCHQDIDRDLGKEAWIIPRKTDCVRSYGYFKAWQLKPDMMVTLDDDCYPEEGTKDFLQAHWERLNQVGKSDAWVSTLDGILPRGIPYYNRERQETRPVVLNHGLWNNVPDFDAPTQLLHERNPKPFTWRDKTIPVGSYFPMCGMNVAIRPEAISAFYFLLMGRGYDFDRFGDIWAGVIIKKIADHLGYCVNSGRPAIKHLRASNVWANLRKEAPGLEINETLWSTVDSVKLTGTTFRQCYREIANGLTIPGAYWDNLRKAMLTWTDLFTD
jgi:reversibly glycosylated polypeptide / UDP-arabinopyranose mutase